MCGARDPKCVVLDRDVLMAGDVHMIQIYQYLTSDVRLLVLFLLLALNIQCVCGVCTVYVYVCCVCEYLCLFFISPCI